MYDLCSRFVYLFLLHCVSYFILPAVFHWRIIVARYLHTGRAPRIPAKGNVQWRPVILLTESSFVCVGLAGSRLFPAFASVMFNAR